MRQFVLVNRIGAVLCVTVMILAAPTARAETAQDILKDAGIKGGLVVYVGCGDGTLTASFGADKAVLVQGLDADPKNVQAARKHIASLGLSGNVSAETFNGGHLPYADNLVNLLVAEDLGDVPRDEVMRVLVPRGVALIRVGENQKTGLGGEDVQIGGSAWSKIVKPWPDEIDEWTHLLHDATGNAVAHDRVVAAPSRLQWIGGPLWSRSHEYDSSLSAMVSAHGRLFSIVDEGPTGIVDKRISDKWTLIARDAFNGVVLWKRPMSDWGWRAWKRAELEQADWQRMQSQRFKLPVAMPRRLVAVEDRVYVTLGYQAPVTALGAATGQTKRIYAGTERADEILHDNGRLVVCVRESAKSLDRPTGKRGRQQAPAGRGTILTFDADTGRRLWQTEPATVIPLSLALSDPHVFFHDGDAVVCLDAVSGRQQWRTPTGKAGNSVWNTDTTLVVYKDVVLCANRRQLVGMSVTDGNELWKLPGAKGFGVGNPPDVFVADGVLWYGQGSLHAESITGYDPLTGKPARTVDLGMLVTRGHHARCYRSKATDNFILFPKRAVEFVDIRGDQHSRHNWVRGACRYGVLPCNGLLYSTPHPCFCYAGVKLGGFLALAGGSSVQSPESRAERRLERGPAHDPALDARPSTLDASDSWPMYRHDPKRSGSISTVVNPSARPAWKTQLGGKVTQSVVADGRLFVARVDAGQVCCLNAATGQSVWDYITGGRIDSAPTYDKGRLIFGSADGCVYCLRASDGVLIWRFRAAPTERRLVAFGQLESAWPVHGSVLVMNDVAYFAAGRSSFLDGGMILYGLDPATGEKRYETHLDGPHPDTTKTLDENAYAMEGCKSDILVTDGTLIYLFHNAFNGRLEKQPTPVKGELGVRNLGVRDFGQHLFSNAGFLDDSGFNRSYWMHGDRWPAFNFAHQSPKAGQLVVFDDHNTYAVKCFVRRNMLSPQFFPATDGYFLVADSNDTRPALVSSDGKGGPEFLRWLPQTGTLQTCWNLGVGFARAEPARWVSNIPVRIRAMVRTGNVLFAAGTPDVCDPKDPTGALEGRKGAVLLAFDPDNGKTLFEYKLDTPPVFDGMSAAGGCLYLSTNDGSVLCLK